MSEPTLLLFLFEYIMFFCKLLAVGRNETKLFHNGSVDKAEEPKT